MFNYTDHLGNVRLSYADLDNNGAIDASTEILDEKNYYPGGLQHQGYNTVVNGTYHPYGFNGKEENNELGLNTLDFGARNYDSALGRWMNIDPKAELLEMSSPFVYSLNSPLVYIDIDGELPILINGKVGSDSDRANEKYWTKEIINTIKNSGIANPGGELHFVDGDRGWNHYNGKSFPSKSNPTFASDRRMGGRLQADADWQTILNKQEKDPKTGKIIEKIQIYTHSRGGAFGVGYTEQLLKLIKENSSLFADSNNVIDFVLNLAPHQLNSLTSPDGVDGYSIDRTWDMLSGDDMGNLNAAFKSSSEKGNLGESHRIKSFQKELGAFLDAFNGSGGNNDKLINSFIDKMKSYGIKVTVQ